MLKKIIPIVAIVLVILSALTYFFLYKDKNTEFIKNLVPNIQNTQQIDTVPIKSEGGFYKISGTLIKEFRFNDLNNYESEFVINGDAQQRKMRIMLATTKEAPTGMPFYSYEDSFNTHPKYVFNDLETVVSKLKPGTIMEAWVGFGLTQLNSYETWYLGKTKELFEGNWAVLDDPKYHIFATAVGVLE